ncbi:hypothetical protein [Anaerovibrio sp.]|uniref:hypothetical protein n=1 Tax=Anaerovibrio sp. TaxID=1872532 RepID=UPI0025B7C6E3|nr:hypothetical protein [Anaerovibrio sp.]MBR2142535.1 hypothetical protein [Anaerovibrio sp.]
MFDKNMIFHGKHADYLRKLAPSKIWGSKFEQRKSIFDNNMQVVELASIIGFIYNRKGEIDRDSSIPDNNIFLEQVTKIKDTLELNYRVIMLLADKNKLSRDERLDRAFRYDQDEDKRAPGDKLFYSYLLGGIELLYEQLIEGSTSMEDDYENLCRFVKAYYMDDNRTTSSIDDILKMCNQVGI